MRSVNLKNSLFGIIFLEPDRLTLRIVELPTLKIITEVQSGALIVGSHNVANYAQNMQAIVDNLQGFQRILREYQVEKFAFYGSLEDLNMVEARYIADQLKVRTDSNIAWLSNNQLMASALAAVMAQMPRFNELSKKALYILTIGLNTTRLSYFRQQVSDVMGYRLGRGARQSPGPNAAPDDDDAKRDYSGLYFKQAGIPGTRTASCQKFQSVDS